MKIRLINIFVIAAVGVGNLFAQWQPDVRLTNDPALSYTSNNNAWCIAASSDVVHVVWFDGRDGNAEIYYKRSTDGGTSWEADTRLTNNPAASYLPSVSVSDQVVHVVWMDERDGNFEIYYKRSTDGGTSWEADTQLTNNTAASWYPSVSGTSSVVHVVWRDERDGNTEIYYKHSNDGGVSWGSDTRLTNNSTFSHIPSVSVSGQVVLVVWYDFRDGNLEIYYKRSTDGGVSWGSDTRLTNNSAESSSPSVAVSGSAVHVVWNGLRDGNFEIYYKRSTDGGVSWEADTRLTNNTALSNNPSVSVSSQVVHAVWRDNRDGNWETYYKRSTDGGVSWEADIRLTSNSAVSEYPSVTVSGQVVHVVWRDERDGNVEIYYKRDPTGSIPVELTSFNATILDNKVQLDWTTATEINNLMFEIERRKDTEEYFTIGYVEGSGTTTELREYSFIDQSVDPGKYFYRLKQIDFNGDYEYSNEIEIEVNGIFSFTLEQNYPNPFNPSTTIKYTIPNVTLSGDEGSRVQLKIYDVLGNKVATLVDEYKPAGSYEVEFDASGLTSGIYFYKIQAGSFVETKKMILIK